MAKLTMEEILGGYEHEIAKSLAGLGEDYEDLLRALLADIRKRLA